LCHYEKDWARTKKIMPAYTFRCSACGHRQVVVRPMSESDVPVLCEVDSFVMHRDYQTDFGKQLFGDIWPFASYAAGASPSEVPELRKVDAEHGVPTDYSADGDPIFRSAKHRKKYCEAHRLFDRNAGYGDPVPARCK